MARGYFITHPDVIIDPQKPIERWGLSPRGRERLRAGLQQPWLHGVGRVLSSSEQKALDGAEILAAALGVPQQVLPELGEYDRSSTGLLPPAEFWALVEQFFAQPEQSIRGWESAADAQARILRAVRGAVAEWQAQAHDAERPDLAIVSHGAVGALLLAALCGAGISREYAQPHPPPDSVPGSGGGYYFSFELPGVVLAHGWRPLDVL